MSPATLDLSPAPGAAPPRARVLAQARGEVGVLLRNGEQLLVAVALPALVLVGLVRASSPDLGSARRIDVIAPGVLALALISSAFTGQAIQTGFDRRYGVLKRLAATAIPRWLLGAGRVLAALTIVAIQVIVLGVVAALLGWAPEAGGVAWAVVLVLLGTIAFGALGVLLGGALRAEIVLAVANIVWFVLLLAGGIALPPSQLDGLGVVAELLPSGALAEGLHTVLTQGGPPGWQPVLVLIIWAAAAGGIATRTTRLT